VTNNTTSTAIIAVNLNPFAPLGALTWAAQRQLQPAACSVATVGIAAAQDLTSDG
jgi:hypothetical protein